MTRDDTRQLQEIFDFTIDGLYANKSGTLSPDQKNKIKTINKLTVKRLSTTFFMAILIIAIGGFVFYKKHGVFPPDIKQIWPFLFYSPIFFVPILIYFLRNKDLRESKISSVSGTLTPEAGKKYNAYNQINFGGTRFYMTGVQAETLKNGYYTIYYIKSASGNIILSVDGG